MQLCAQGSGLEFAGCGEALVRFGDGEAGVNELHIVIIVVIALFWLAVARLMVKRIQSKAKPDNPE